MKKTILLALTFFLSINVFAQEKKEIKWHSFEEVTELAAKEPKMIIVKVYTDWCGWCKKMDKKTFTDRQVIDYINNNFYPAALNAEDTGTKFSFRGREFTEASMARTMRASSFPNFVIMDATMENITLLPGYREPEAFVSSLESLLENFNPK